MKRIKMTLSFDADTLTVIEEGAKAAGFFKPQEFARYLVMRGLQIESDLGNDTRVVPVKLKNYSEIENYVEAKRLGSIPVFADFAMGQYMARFPRKMPSNAVDRKNIDA